jgi:hypothetical protein
VGNPIALPEIFKQGMQDFVVPQYVVAPFTTIQNRAKVSNSLKAIAGVERIPVWMIKLLANETGPNGETVQAPSDTSPIRFVGNGWANINTNIGSCIQATAANNQYLEITFYGTGLNILTIVNNFARDIRVTIDGGVEGANIFNGGAATGSAILNSSIWNTNQIMQIVSNLTLGWHTVKIRNNSANGFQFYGFDIINERSDLAVLSGSGIAQTSSVGLATMATSSFKQGVIGSRGARVVKYVEGGLLKSAVTEVATTNFMSLTDHSSEEVVRRISWREFGINRSDDFSTLATTSNRAFTLDDDSTTLVGSQVSLGTYSGFDCIFPVSAGFITLTFTGTGLDLATAGTPVATYDAHTVFVDNVQVDTTLAGSALNKTIKICSGLPYGTHTVKLLRTGGSGNGLAIYDFVIYQPKKPSIPTATFEVCDFNVLADYAALTSSNIGAISAGVIRKFSVREVAYVGSGWTFSSDVANFNSGWNLRTTVSGDFAEFSFWGTGIEWQTSMNGGSVYNVTVAIDGASNLSAFTSAFITATTGVTWNSTTGTLTGTASAGANHATLKIANLPLGLHKIKISTASTAFVYLDSFDVTTPIHINEPSFKIGSQSLRSNQNYEVIKPLSDTGPDLTSAKAWINYDTLNSKVVSSFNVAAVSKRTTGAFDVFFEKSIKRGFVAVGSCGTGMACRVTGISGLSNIPGENTTYGCEAITYNSGGAVVDATFCLVVFGEYE